MRPQLLAAEARSEEHTSELQSEPRLFGFPFFYWYQLLWVFLAAGLCGLSFWLLKREREAYERRQHDGSATATGGTR